MDVHFCMFACVNKQILQHLWYSSKESSWALSVRMALEWFNNYFLYTVDLWVMGKSIAVLTRWLNVPFLTTRKTLWDGENGYHQRHFKAVWNWSLLNNSFLFSLPLVRQCCVKKCYWKAFCWNAFSCTEWSHV